MSDITLSHDMRVELVDRVGTDESVIRAAKVSTNTDNVAATDPERFINYLMRNRHLSPFEHCSVTFRIEAPIFVWRELMRHRMLSYSELSARYSKMEPTFYAPSPRRNLVQQGKPGEYTFAPAPIATYDAVMASIKDISIEAYVQYQAILELGVAREVARMVLPVNIYSTAYVTGNLRNWLKFLSLRTIDATSMFPSYPQREIEMVAEQVESILTALYPATLTTWSAQGRVGA